MSSSHDIVVIGAGVLGACAAAELALRGRQVTVIDPGGANASSIAAGMIAPAMESVLEGLDPPGAALLRSARDLWPAFAAATGVRLVRDGAVWRGPDAADRAARLRALGFTAVEAPGEVFTPDDWRLAPPAALAALGAVSGVSRMTGKVGAVSRDEAWRVSLADGEVLIASDIVVATGASGIDGPPALDAVLARIQPIRGQLVRVAASPPAQAVRGAGVYAAPSDDGLVFGATMEAGVRDLTADPAGGRAMVEAGAALLGRGDIQGGFDCRVGVRGASPDGLPMAGRIAQGLHVTLAPRRNGWLLGPAAAAVVADAIERRPPDARAAAFDPLRFD